MGEQLSKEKFDQARKNLPSAEEIAKRLEEAKKSPDWPKVQQ